MVYVCVNCKDSFLSSGPIAKYCASRCRDAYRYKVNKVARLEAVREHRAKNLDAINQRRREAWAAAGKAETSRRNRESYEKNREARIRYALEYQRRNPPTRTRHRRRAAISFTVTASDLSRLVLRSRGKCSYCATQVGANGKQNHNSLQWDHVVPLSRGGCNSIGNLLPSCRRCNLQKNAKTLMEWKMSGRWFEND